LKKRRKNQDFNSTPYLSPTRFACVAIWFPLLSKQGVRVRFPNADGTDTFDKNLKKALEKTPQKSSFQADAISLTNPVRLRGNLVPSPFQGEG